MTVFGKILVFINLVFSLVVGALVVMVYIARTNYAVEYERLAKRHEVAQQNTLQAHAARTKAEVDLDSYKKEAESALKASDALVLAKTGEVDRLTRQATGERQKNETIEAALKAAQIEVDHRQADVVKMRETLRSEMDKNITLVKDNNLLKDNTTASQLQAAALLDRNKQLEGQVQDLARDNARIKSNVPGGATTPVRNVQNPPAEDIRGLVKAADPTGLVQIDIGSDHGLVRGNTLLVFRLAPIPSQSKFLGTIRIVDVRANEAVAQTVGRALLPLQAGDRVASRL